MADNYEVKSLTDIVDGNPCTSFPTSLAQAIKMSADADENLTDVLKDITPVVLSRAEYERRVESGEIGDDDTTYYYVPDGDVNRFEINDATITKRTTFSSKKLAEIFASVGVSTSGDTGSGSGTVIITDAVKQTTRLLTDKWKDNTYSIIIPGVTEKSTVIVEVSNSLNDEDYAYQYNEYKNADIRRIKKSKDKIEFVSYGTIPNNIIVDITIL